MVGCGSLQHLSNFDRLEGLSNVAHFLILVIVHVLDLEPGPLPVVQQVVWESIAFVSPHHLEMDTLMIVVTKQ